MSFESNHLVQFDVFTLDLDECTLWKEGEMISLAPKVMATLCFLARNPGRLITKQEMMDHLWADTFVEERNLTQNIFTLRKVLGEGESTKQLIETVPRRGYRFVADVRAVEMREHLHVSQRKQTRITADGLVSPAELENALTEVGVTVQGAAIHSAETGSQGASTSRRHLVLLVVGITAILTMGSVLWTWQRTADSQDYASRNVLSFERLTDSGKAFFPAISPNEQFFAYLKTHRALSSIELQNIATGSRTVVVGPTENELGRPKFSPDGNYLFYREVAKRGDLGTVYRIPIFGGTPRAIAGSLLSNPAVSPDGEWLAFIRSSSVVKGQELVICRSKDGTEERVVASRMGDHSFTIWNFSPSWSPDGKRVFVGLIARPSAEKPDATSEGFGLMNIEDGSFERLNIPEWSGFSQAEWMPDGRSIVFLAKERANDLHQIWRVDYPAGTGIRITNDSHDYGYFNVPSSGNFILATQERTLLNLWAIPVDDPGAPKQLTFSSEIQHGQRGISWTPDGRQLVYTRNESAAHTNLWSMDLSTLEQKQLTFDEQAVNWFPSITSDGAIFFTSNRGQGTHIWAMDINGNNLHQVTHGVSEGFSNVSSDGKWLVYATPAWDPESLWKRSLTDDTDPIKLLSAAGGSNSLSPDASHLIVSYKSTDESGRLVYRYGLMPFEQNASPEDLTFNPHLGAIAWTPDRQGFYYLKDLGTTLSDIWYYDLMAGSHRQVTDFGGQMFSLSISPDGRTLATARGENYSNVFRISGF